MKTVKSVQHYLEQALHTTVVVFEDDSVINIFVQRGMIFVADCNYTELSKRIDADEYEAYEAYDTVDGVDYFASSEYAELISTALLYICNRLL